MSFFRYLWLTCSGFRSYVLLLDLPLRSSLGYWAILSGLLAAVATADFTHEFKSHYLGVVQETAGQIPEFRIQNGQASTSLNQPYFSKIKEFLIILDLESLLKDPEKMFPQKTGAVIKKDALLLWLDPAKQQILWFDETKPIMVSWKDWPNGTVNAVYLEKFLEKLVSVLRFFFPGFWIGIALLGVFQALFFTLFARCLERSSPLRFTFRQLFNISLFSITPGAVIVAAYVMMKFDEIRYDILFFSSYCFVFFMAFDACRSFLHSPKDQKAEED